MACELQEVNGQLNQQSDFCATMGAACCTLLWRVTRCEDSIPTILVGVGLDTSFRDCNVKMNIMVWDLINCNHIYFRAIRFL